MRDKGKEVIQDQEETVVKKPKQEIDELKEENKQVKTKLSECQSEINKLKYSRDGINKELVKKTSEFGKLKQQIDSIDQKQREARVRITGITEEEGEDLTKKIVKLAKSKMGMKKIKDTDIIQIHRSGKKKTT